eukprot:6178644-Pleurochrysis_carterae.AAC.3
MSSKHVYFATTNAVEHAWQSKRARHSARTNLPAGRPAVRVLCQVHLRRGLGCGGRARPWRGRRRRCCRETASWCAQQLASHAVPMAHSHEHVAVGTDAAHAAARASLRLPLFVWRQSESSVLFSS